MDSAFPDASTLEDVMAAAPEFAREIESAIARDEAAIEGGIDPNDNDADSGLS